MARYQTQPLEEEWVATDSPMHFESAYKYERYACITHALNERASVSEGFCYQTPFRDLSQEITSFPRPFDFVLLSLHANTWPPNSSLSGRCRLARKLLCGGWYSIDYNHSRRRQSRE